MDKNKLPNSQLSSVTPSKKTFPKRSIDGWKDIISSYLDGSCSLTTKQFCKKRNISKSSFYKWRCKLYPDSFTKKPGKFIAVRQAKESEKFISRDIPKISSISSPLKISLGSISLEFTRGCELSELSQIISLLNAA